MSLFHLSLNGTEYYVIAETMVDALEIWKARDPEDWGNEATDEEPESCALVYDGPVLQRENGT